MNYGLGDTDFALSKASSKQLATPMKPIVKGQFNLMVGLYSEIVVFGI